MSSKEDLKAYRERLKAAGKCLSHPDRDSEAGTTNCEECRQRGAERRQVSIASGKCGGHPNEDVLLGKTICKRCAARTKRRYRDLKNRGYCTVHRMAKVTRGLTVCQECVDYRRQWNQTRRAEVLQKIADAHSTSVACQYLLHPNMPGELKSHRCWGRLTIEHPNGGGGKDLKENGPLALVREILNGKRNPKDYYILCVLHQIWNWSPHDSLEDTR